MTRYYRTIYGATASITEHNDGSATLRTMVAGKRTSKKYKNIKSAQAAWYRMTD